MSVCQVYTKNGIGRFLNELQQAIVASATSGAANVQYLVLRGDQLEAWTDNAMSAGEIAAVGAFIAAWSAPVISADDEIVRSASKVLAVSIQHNTLQYRETNKPNWSEIATLVYDGTNVAPRIQLCRASLWNATAGQTSELRITNLSNGSVICTISTTTGDSDAISGTSAIANLPASKAKLSIQMKAQGGKARCSDVLIYM